MTLVLTFSLLLFGDIGNIGDVLHYQSRTLSPLFRRQRGTWGTMATQSFLRPHVPFSQVHNGDIANLVALCLSPLSPLSPRAKGGPHGQ
jgi:hypothetical protein